MAITIQEKLVFIESMQFISSILKSLVEYLPKFKCKYQFQEFQGVRICETKKN